MNLAHLPRLVSLLEQRTKLDKEIEKAAADLVGPERKNHPSGSARKAKTPTRHISEAGKKRIAAAQRKRWAIKKANDRKQLTTKTAK